MQKTLEILKKEDGLIIKRLSYKKLLFVYQVPILLGISSDVVVGYLPVKIRYRTNKDPFKDLKSRVYPVNVAEFGSRFVRCGSNDHSHDYQCCDLTRIYRSISQRYGIKMNQIGTGYGKRTINIQGEDVNFDKVIKDFYIIDPAWIRNYKLENLI